MRTVVCSAKTCGTPNLCPCSSATFTIAGFVTISSGLIPPPFQRNSNEQGWEKSQIPKSVAIFPMLCIWRERSASVNSGLLYGSNALVKFSANSVLELYGKVKSFCETGWVWPLRWKVNMRQAKRAWVVSMERIVRLIIFLMI